MSVIKHPKFPKTSTKIMTYKSAPMKTKDSIWSFQNGITTLLKNAISISNLNYFLQIDDIVHFVTNAYKENNEIIVCLKNNQRDSNFCKKTLMSQVIAGEATPVYEMKIGFYNSNITFSPI